MLEDSHYFKTDFNRRKFLSSVGKGFGIMALSSATVASLFENLQAASKKVAHLSPEQAAADEDFWAVIQQSFSVTRGIVNLNNGGVSPSPRIVTEAFVRYTWQQEDATAYTMWQILEPQSETIRTGLAEIFGCDAEEIAITRNASESLEILLMGLDLKSGDFDDDAGLSANADDASPARIARGIKIKFNQNPDCAEKC
jgi:hypothetical protein